MVEGKRREHGPVSVHLRLDHQRRAAHAVDLQYPPRVPLRVRVRDLRHQRPVGRQFCVPFNDDFVRAHALRQLQCRGAVLPRVEVVRPDVGLAFFVEVALHAVGHYNGLVVRSEVLDERGWRFNDVRVHPQHPGGEGAHCGEKERVARARHGGAPHLLILELMPCGFVLGSGDLEVLPQDGYAGEAAGFGAGLGSLNGFLQCGGGGIALLVFGYDKSERDEVVWVGES